MRDVEVLDFGRMKTNLANILALPGPRVVVNLNRDQPPLVIFCIKARLLIAPILYHENNNEMISKGFLQTNHRDIWLDKNAPNVDAFLKENCMYEALNITLHGAYEDFYLAL